MPKNNEPEGVRKLKAHKRLHHLTAGQMSDLLGYTSTDSYFRICRYEYSPDPDRCAAIAKVIGRSRAWVMDHWASEVAARKRQRAAAIERIAGKAS